MESTRLLEMVSHSALLNNVKMTRTISVKWHIPRNTSGVFSQIQQVILRSLISEEKWAVKEEKKNYIELLRKPQSCREFQEKTRK